MCMKTKKNNNKSGIMTWEWLCGEFGVCLWLSVSAGCVVCGVVPAASFGMGPRINHRFC